MAIKFQSDEYFEAANVAMQNSPEVLKAAKGHDVRVQVVTTDFPGQGVKKTWLKIEKGIPTAGPGVIEEPTSTITQNYETAVLLDKGELNPQVAFMEGKMKIKGNLMKMMTLQKFLVALGPAAKDIERDYEVLPNNPA